MRAHPSWRGSGWAAGFSLVELMVAMAVGLILLGGLISIVVSTSQANRDIEAASRQVENGRYSVATLTTAIQHAGYYGTLGAVGTAVPTTSPCLTTESDLQAQMVLPIQGYDAPAAVGAGTALSCIADGNHLAGTDVLVVRRAATVTTEPTALSLSEIYLQSTPTQALIAMGDPANFTLTTNTGAIAPIRKYNVEVYFVSPCSVPTASSGGVCDTSADGGRPIPTLKRLALGSDGTALAWTTEPIAEGIENLQIDYGIDADGEGSPDTYVTTAATAADWMDVMTLKLHVLARNIDSSAGYVEHKTYDLGLANGAYAPAATEYRRHLFTSAVRAINLSSRRENR
jgi:type IV pilus assembly protein PilW